MPCVFCQIASGAAEARTVYETDRVLAFLDVNPLAPGHTLVIPTAHHERVDDLPADLAGDLFQGVHAVTSAVEDAVSADATTVAINNGRAAGQEVPHVHAHIVPRFRDDGAGPIHRLFDARPSLDPVELDDIASRIRAGV